MSPSPKHRDLPWDLWFVIVHFLPRTALASIRRVNRTLNDVVLYLQCGTLVLNACGCRDYTQRVLARATSVSVLSSLRGLLTSSCSQFNRRVSSLEIRPWWCEPADDEGIERGALLPRIKSRLSRLVARQYLAKQAQRRLGAHIERDISSIVEAVSTLPTVATYSVLVSEDEEEYHPKLIKGFLLRLLGTVGWAESLVKFALCVPPQQWVHLAPIRLPNLIEFDWRITTGREDKVTINGYLDPMFVFIHNLASTLSTLSITSTNASLYLDLSWFFSRLEAFRYLSGFTLSIPFDGAHVTNQRVLRDWLLRHGGSLARIRLGASQCQVRGDVSNPEAKYWIQSLFTTFTEMPNLRQLEFALRPLRADLAPLYDCLRMLTMGGQLESVTFTDRALTLKEIIPLVDALHVHTSCEYDCDTVPSVQSLGLRVRQLSPQLLNVIASKLPKLRSLSLHVESLSHYEDPDDRHHTDSVSRPVQLRLFLIALSQLSYLRKWDLAHLSISECRVPGHVWIDKLEPAMIRVIPSLTSFTELNIGRY